MIKVGIIGYGYWGSKHARVLSGFPDVQLTIIDRSHHRLEEAHIAFRMARVVAELDDVIGDLDAAIVATPARSHAAVAMRALGAGCHVLVEKPLATSTIECEQLIDTAERAALVLMSGHTFEYNGAVWKLKELVDSGELGDIYYIDSARLNLGRYQGDVNVIWDLAPHDVSIVNYLLERSPRSVTTWAQQHAGMPVEDVAYLKLGYEDPVVTAYVHVSWLDPHKVRRVTVVGSRKMAVYNDVATNEPIRIYDSAAIPAELADPSIPSRPMTYRYGDIVSLCLSYEEPLAVEDRTFVDCVLTGSRPPSDGPSGLAVVRVLEAACQALATGRAIDPTKPVATGWQPVSSGAV
jgi:predicted dehydrogenase